MSVLLRFASRKCTENDEYLGCRYEVSSHRRYQSDTPLISAITVNCLRTSKDQCCSFLRQLRPFYSSEKICKTGKRFYKVIVENCNHLNNHAHNWPMTRFMSWIT